MKRIDNDWEFTEEFNESFLKGEGTFETVRIPHTVKEVPLHYIDPKSYQMICGYRKKITIPASMQGKRIFMQLDGAAHIATVYVNGRELCTHRCGYTGFRVEITDAISFSDDNLIAIKLDTTENPSIPPFGFVIDYLTFGGIYRDVWLDAKEQTYLKDVYVRTPDLNTALVQFEMDGDCSGMTVIGELLDDNGNSIQKLEGKAENRKLEMHVSDIQPWSNESPVLYRFHLTLLKQEQKMDEAVSTFGFRTISLTENNICINGKPVFLRGLNRHQCWPYIGYAASERLQREDAQILQEELGVNAVRTSHYPQSHYFLDECDRRGLLVFTEIPGWQHIGESKEWKDQCVENVKEMVLEYRQHPSIILWGVRVNESQDDDELYTRTNAAAHELDPDRPTSGVRYLEKSSFLEDVYAYNDFSHYGTNAGAKAKKDVTPDEKKPLLISEANGHMFPTKPYDSWQRRQEHALRHARVLDQAMKDGGHAGCFQWCMFDYPTHQDFGSGDRICYHGVMDSFRNPKLASALYASQSDQRPVLEIGSSMDIGDYPAGQIGEIYAFTNADEVKLYKNGQYVNTFKSKQWQGLKHGPILIDDTIGKLLETNEHMSEKEAALVRECLLSIQETGMSNMKKSTMVKLGYVMMKYHLKYADGYRLYGTYLGNWGGKATEWRFDAVKDGKVVSSVIKTPGQKLHLEVKTGTIELTDGDTYDMSDLRIRILDENNNIAPYAQLPVFFHLEGGSLRLIGPDMVCAEGGMCGTYLKTTGKEGTASLTISTGQTDPVTIKFKVNKEGEKL